MLKKTNRVSQLFTLGTLLYMTLTHASPLATTPVINTSQGPIQGIVQESMQQYKGIPYAKPPLGAQRWQPPIAAEPWTSTRATTAFGPTCATKLDLAGFGPTSNSEDCLYLNVYAPTATAEQGKRPVMVVIPGGGLIAGSGNEYNPQKLVEQGLIVVSFNYRLGVFGYFSHPALNAEGHAAINYGTLDQQAALRWVRDNIAQFGGDPDNVTLYGESAGGQSVLTHLAAPASAGLFHKGIVSSGAYLLQQRTVAEHNLAGEALAQSLGCTDAQPSQVAACLRRQSTDTLLEHGLALAPSFGVNSDAATVDGTILPMSLEAAFSSGQYHQVPVINGFNADEGSFFVGLMALGSEQPLNLASFAQAIPAFFNAEKTQKVINLLKKRPSSGNLGQDYAEVFGKAKFICSTPTTNALLAQRVPVYGYEFADDTSPTLLPPTTFPYGAAHINDLQYLFKDFHGATGPITELNPAQKQLSKRMVAYFSHFAKTGTPNGPGLPQWQTYAPQSDSVMRLHPDPTLTGMTPAMSERYGCTAFQSLN
ncbi:MAG: carboxylesterase family protein [Neisseriaceae bacterium]|nr:carboxylesterase family protein [Neisseriaceae bacterium]MBP6862947.1 carboxylesterase family protein [Neisseriaceae bacterium]